MSDDNANPYPTGTYVKDGRTRVADTPAEAVAAAFDGYAFQAPEADEADEPEVDEPQAEGDNPEAPVTDDDDTGAPSQEVQDADVVSFPDF